MIDGMHPKSGPRPTDSHAERRIYEALAREGALPEGVVGWHSLAFTVNNREHEIDFLLAHPERGFIAIEAKGGQIKLEDGFWLQNGQRMKAPPTKQAIDAAHALARYLREAHHLEPPLEEPAGPPELPPLFRDIERRTFQFFWDTTNEVNGLTPDRFPSRPFASIASVGFSLTASQSRRRKASRRMRSKRPRPTLVPRRTGLSCERWPHASWRAGMKGRLLGCLSGRSRSKSEAISGRVHASASAPSTRPLASPLGRGGLLMLPYIEVLSGFPRQW